MRFLLEKDSKWLTFNADDFLPSIYNRASLSIRLPRIPRYEDRYVIKSVYCYRPKDNNKILKITKEKYEELKQMVLNTNPLFSIPKPIE